MSDIIIAGTTCQGIAREVADETKTELGQLTVKRFPDGELYVRIESDVRGKDCAVIQSTSNPHGRNLIELFLLIDTLKELGAKRIKTVVPFFGYGRQDKSFNPGEAVTSKTVAKHIGIGTDEFYSINLHKDRILDFFNVPAKNLDASPILGEYFKTYDIKSPVVIGPDRGAVDMAKSVAGILGGTADYLEKKRLGPGKVEMKPKTLSVKDKDVILVDDIIDSGGTMLMAGEMLKSQGALNVMVGCIHPVLTTNIVTKLFAAGAADVVATNTIPSQISFITVSSLIADAIKG
jgi:ribose-phosphate pyrophosphokinase